jgi:hypothetical protein
MLHVTGALLGSCRRGRGAAQAEGLLGVLQMG